MKKLKIFSGNAGLPLANKVCEHLGIELGKVEVKRFADGEVGVQILEDVRNKDVFVINSTPPPFENFLEMILIGKAAFGSSAKRITQVPTYLGYNRQDRKDKPRVCITAKIVAEMLALSCNDRMLLFDLHSEPTMGFFPSNMRVDHLYAAKVAIDYLRDMLGPQYVVAAPDKGGAPRARAYASRIGTNDLVFFDKVRVAPGQIDGNGITIIGDVRRKNVLFVDDMIDTGGTLIADAAAAKDAGAERILCFATHALFSNNAVLRLDGSAIDEVVVTDSIYHAPSELQTTRVKITTLSIAPLLAEAIQRIHRGKSLHDLFV